jgi:hypothetical protein
MSTWTEHTWHDLLAYIEARSVVPIVGRELLQVTPKGGQPVRLERFVAERLARDFDLSIPPDELTLNAAVSAHLGKGGKRPQLYSRVREIMDTSELEPPLVLRQLAEITDFQLFLTTNFDLLLEQAINLVRFQGQPSTLTLAYAPTRVPGDLPTAIRSLSQPTVYHLLGVQSTTPSYVLSDEDLLEFVCGLQGGSKRPERLFEELEDQHLLMLGEGFDDWLARLFLRITRSSRGRRLSEDRDVWEYMVETTENNNTGLVRFLRTFSSMTMVYPSGGATEFVGELYRRWRERHPVRAPVSRPRVAARPAAEGKDIFISYASDDVIAASTLKEDLERAGFTVWFDKRQLSERVGHKWETEIGNNIKSCALFMPLLSAATEDRPDAYFREEWRLADARTRRQFGADQPFIIPVVLDDTHGIRNIPESFRAPQMTRLPGGHLTAELADQLHVMLDEMRRNGAGAA